MNLLSSYARRDALKVALGALLPVPLLQQQDSSVARLYRPNYAGRPRQRVTDYENDPFIVALEGKLRCTCGCNLDVYTCRTTDFTCGVSPAMHREVVVLVERDKTADEILDAFVAKYGETVLMAPKKEGFNIAAYVVPGISIAMIGGSILLVLVLRARRLEAVAVRGGTGPEGPSPEAEMVLEQELAKLGR